MDGRGDCGGGAAGGGGGGAAVLYRGVLVLQPVVEVPPGDVAVLAVLARVARAAARGGGGGGGVRRLQGERGAVR